LAGFQVTLNGRFWVTPEELTHYHLPNLSVESRNASVVGA